MKFNRHHYRCVILCPDTVGCTHQARSSHFPPLPTSFVLVESDFFFFFWCVYPLSCSSVPRKLHPISSSRQKPQMAVVSWEVHSLSQYLVWKWAYKTCFCQGWGGVFALGAFDKGFCFSGCLGCVSVCHVQFLSCVTLRRSCVCGVYACHLEEGQPLVVSQ